MLKEALLRTGAGLLVLAGVFCLSFILIRTAPGRPSSSLDQASSAARENRERRLGMDRELLPALGSTAGAYLTGDLGFSLVGDGNTRVGAILARSWPVSLELGLWALLPTLLLGIGGGLILGATRPGPLTFTLSAAGLVLISGSALGLGTLVRILLSMSGHFQVGGWDDLLDRLIPAAILGSVYGAYLMQVTAASARAAAAAPWVVAARARGLSPRGVLVRRILPGTLVPILEYLGPIIANLLTGSFIIEVMFEVPGLARCFMDAIMARDYPVVLASVMLYTLTLTSLNIILELVHLTLDPRLRPGEAA